MTSSIPKVSVCIPVFNPGSFLQTAIQSVLDQDYSDYELLIVDDGSLISVAPTVEQHEDPRIRFYRYDDNVGLPANWNRCIELSHGQYIAILHQDDVMLPGCLSKKVDMLDREASVGFVYSDVVAINEAGEIVGGHHIQPPEDDTVIGGCEFYRMVSETGDPVACSSVVVRAGCYRELGFYDTSLPFATDLEMWLRIAAQYDVGFLAEKLNAIRLHSKQETAKFAYTGRDYLDTMGAFDRISIDSIPVECARFLIPCYTTLAKHAIPMARWQLRKGKFSGAFRYFVVLLTATGKAIRYRIMLAR